MVCLRAASQASLSRRLEVSVSADTRKVSAGQGQKKKEIVNKGNTKKREVHFTHKLEQPADVAAVETHCRTQAGIAEELVGVAAAEVGVVVVTAFTLAAKTAAATATMSLALANIVAGKEINPRVKTTLKFGWL